ncbi:MAG: branched-chain amino acid transport system substrate-binding protein [Halobacteriales archaeon]|jgi:branched-chain amino acid transport system substrate-binding protein
MTGRSKDKDEKDPAANRGIDSLRSSSRRAFLSTGAALTIASLAGCSGDGGGESTTTEGGDDDTTEKPDDGTTERETTTESPTTTESEDYPDEVYVGSIHPYTGPTSYVGDRLHKAMELAATIKNENGGIESMNGAEVRFLRGDHKNQPETGAEVAQELIDEGASVLTGTYSSAVTNAITRVAESNGVPFVIDISVAASILQQTPLNYVYRAQPNSWNQASDMIRGLSWASDQAGVDVETLGLFYIDNTYGQAIRDGIERAVEDRDMEIITEATIGFGGTADTQVTKFRNADPDVIIPTVFTNQILELVSAMKDQDYWPKVLHACSTGGMNSANYEKMGKVIEGSMSSGYQVNKQTEKAQEINERYMNTYDTAPMEGNIGMAYATAEVIIAAFEEAGSADPEVLNQTLQNIEVEDHIMAMPPIQFDETGENADGLTITNQVQNMQNEIVYPDRYATADLTTDTIGN